MTYRELGVEEFKAPFEQTKSKEWLGIFVNGSIHNWGTPKNNKAPRHFWNYFLQIIFIWKKI
jgi:hypothetical protein